MLKFAAELEEPKIDIPGKGLSLLLPEYGSHVHVYSCHLYKEFSSTQYSVDIVVVVKLFMASAAMTFFSA